MVEQPSANLSVKELKIYVLYVAVTVHIQNGTSNETCACTLHTL